MFGKNNDKMFERAVIYKYIIPPSSFYNLLLPGNALPVYLGEQDGEVCVWVAIPLQDPEPPTTFKFIARATGEQFSVGDETYLGTVQMQNGLVWHFFLELKET